MSKKNIHAISTSLAILVVMIFILILNTHLDRHFYFLIELLIVFAAVGIVSSIVFQLYIHHYTKDIQKHLRISNYSIVDNKLSTLKEDDYELFYKVIYLTAIYCYEQQQYDDFLKHINKLDKSIYRVIKHFWLFQYNFITGNTETTDKEYKLFLKEASFNTGYKKILEEFKTKADILNKIRNKEVLTSQETTLLTKLFKDSKTLEILTNY